MTTLDALLAAKATAIAAFDAAISSAGGSTADADDPMTAPLDARGVWRPSWLKAANAAVEARFPGLIKPGPGIGEDGKPTSATPIKLIDGFIFQPIARRADISDAVRELYQREHNRTWLASTTGDFPNILAYMHLDEPVVPGPGYLIASLHSKHQDPEEVKTKLRRLYRIHDLLP